MGYDLHITRKKFWADPDGPIITADEWLAYVATDPQLQLDLNSQRHAVKLLIESEHAEAWLAWFQGDVYTKDPDERILAKMLEIAKTLNARVQGDDGEIYRSANFEDFFGGIEPEGTGMLAALRGHAGCPAMRDQPPCSPGPARCGVFELAWVIGCRTLTMNFR